MTLMTIMTQDSDSLSVEKIEWQEKELGTSVIVVISVTRHLTEEQLWHSQHHRNFNVRPAIRLLQIG